MWIRDSPEGLAVHRHVLRLVRAIGVDAVPVAPKGRGSPLVLRIMRDPSSSSQSPKGPKQLLKTHLDETADPIADRAKAEGVDPAPHVQLVDGGIAVLATSTQVSGKNPGAVALDEGAGPQVPM